MFNIGDLKEKYKSHYDLESGSKEAIEGGGSFESLLTEQEINVLDMEREPVSLPYRYSR